MVKKILDWTEAKFEEIDVDNDKHPMLKAFGLGAIQGAIDGAVIAYPFLVVGAYLSAREIKKLKGE